MSRVFQVYRDSSGPLHAVPAGPAWLALPLPWAWALARRLWFRGALLLLVDALLGAFVPSLLASQAPALALALLVPRLFAFLRGHDWAAAAQEDAGREYLGRLVAASASDAVAQVARRDGRIPDELKPRSAGWAFAFPPPSLQAPWAVVCLTLQAAFRYRLVVVLMVLLLGAVAVLPAIIKHDETAQGFTQILLTYTLGIITALLSLVTLWLACGTLARDIDECQMQVVASKPIPRWQIWLGKWVGIVALDAMLLGLSAGAVYLLMQWRATQLPPQVQQALRNNILTARAVAREQPPDLDSRVDALVRERLPELQSKGINLAEFRKQAYEMAKAREQLIPPDHFRRVRLDFRGRTADIAGRTLFARIQFHTPELGQKRPYEIEIQAGPPESAQRVGAFRGLAAETFHEIELGPAVLDAEGWLVIDIANRSGVPLLLPIDDGFSILYPEGGFGLNFVRALLVILCWLGLLAAIGLTAASFLSFPVASFLATSVLILGLSTGTLKSVVEDGTVLGLDHETNMPVYPALDFIMVPVFRAALDAINLVQQFSPIDAVSSGRSITWSDVARSVALVIGLFGGAFGAVGVIAFTRRELATAQSNH